jgi:uncharacterized protein YceH (UPF0502 family)
MAASRKPEQSHWRDAVLKENPTGADAERLHTALQRERDAHRMTRRAFAAMTERIEALEAQQLAPAAGPDMATITGALAGIRSDLRAELAALRAELEALSDRVDQFVRS